MSPPESSPIQIIPPEILCHIFTLTVPPLNATSAYVHVARRVDSSQSWTPREPWVLGQVCSYWRSQALALPTLWSSISFSTSPWPRELSLCHTQLARSGTAPLDLLIRFTVEGPYRDRTEVDKFMAKLVSLNARWRSLHLEFTYHYRTPPSFFTSLGPNPLPLLEEVVLGGVGIYIGDKQKFFENVPALRRVVLSDLGVMSADGVGSNQKIPLPWRHITTYKATYLHADKLLQNLAAAVNLVECDITFTRGGPSYEDTLWRDVLTLPRLRRLVISHPVFLNCLAAPALKSLYIIGPVEHVLPFLRRSGCTETLSALTLTQYTVPAPELIGLLHDTPGLRALALDLDLAPVEVVAALMAPQRLCPKLKSLSWADFDDKLERDAFADMVTSRCTGAVPEVCRLRSIAIYSGRRRMKSAGWRLRLIPNLDVLTVTAKKGRPAVKQWRDY
ncbi:hypothetical protein DFH08DRAFT_321870 [Mycena albidolilacea]|uniref:F-box domain-containing protein n=1 Tax=Mycena albidolilacea TaxID=1033008 RepID=A0AAD7ALG9_9AGAR|nr:hypothetical protein DFH08DRAFT_321870 [Mycena albidolilacea]